MGGSSTMASGKGKLWAALAAVALSLVVALGFAAPTQASAADGSAGLAAGSVQVTTQDDVEMMNPDWVSLWVNSKETSTVGMFLMNVSNDTKVTKVVTSDSSVLKVTKLDSDNKAWSYEVLPLKVGKATLSVTVSQGGVTKILSETYAVKLHPNAFTSITFNGKSLTVPTSKAPITASRIFEFKGTKAKVDVKAASGWTVSSISGHMYKNGTSGTSIGLTNGKEFTIPKGQQCHIFIDLYNATTYEYVSYDVDVYRDQPLTMDAKTTYYIGYPKVSMPHFKIIYGGVNDITVLSVKSSAPAIIKAKKNKRFNKVQLRAMKPGKSKITIKYQFEGKTYTTSAMSTASKDFPVKAAFANGKSLSLKKYCSAYYPKTYKKNTAKVKITPAKGWKVKSLVCYSGYSDIKGKKVKNGATVKTPQGQATTVVATLKKGKSTYEYRWYFDRA